jgi:hypothetical protein
MPLDEFAQALVDEYHMVPKPKTIPNNILANVALLVCNYASYVAGPH